MFWYHWKTSFYLFVSPRVRTVVVCNGVRSRTPGVDGEQFVGSVYPDPSLTSTDD